MPRTADAALRRGWRILSRLARFLAHAALFLVIALGTGLGSACALMALARRFEAGVLSAPDAIKVIGAGLRGAGNDIDDATVARMTAEGGAPGFVAIVAELLAATFGGGEG